ncbi:hypothetical protein DSC45_35020 [Streptomyces sp. YIM 130001]|nr:hypothetical protein DSC45_35020 [Streptomyces sp. YIM 130001]
MRLVAAPDYQDVALSVYVKVKALASRPEGCQARSATIASYLGISRASAERGMTQLSRPGPGGVVELRSVRRTLPGGRGQSAVRTLRPMIRVEEFVWLPVAAAEDLTPRQLRAFALIAYAQVRGIGLTETELASGLAHHSGRRAGKSLSVTAAGAIVDELEAAGWLTVQRRAGARGRHRFIAHDIASLRCTATDTADSVLKRPETAVREAEELAFNSQAREGSGSQTGEGSLASRELPRTDSPNEGAPGSPAVGEVPVCRRALSLGSPACNQDVHRGARGGLALRAGGQNHPSAAQVKNRSSRSRRARGPYDGPQLTMSAQIYAVLEPAHVLLRQVTSTFVARQIAREVGRQLKSGTAPERLQHRLTARLAKVLLSNVRDPGRWLLGVALPRWGCGHPDCEAGILWSSGRTCEICAQISQGKYALRGDGAGRSSGCSATKVRDDDGPATASDALRAPRRPKGPPRGACRDCACRILLTGPALEDGRCKPCRVEHGSMRVVAATSTSSQPKPATCSGTAGGQRCPRPSLPFRSVCARHRIEQVSTEERTGATVSAVLRPSVSGTSPEFEVMPP